jgi:hypothetical protein
VYPSAEIDESFVQVFPIRIPRYPVHPGCRITLERVIGVPE